MTAGTAEVLVSDVAGRPGYFLEQLRVHVDHAVVGDEDRWLQDRVLLNRVARGRLTSPSGVRSASHIAVGVHRVLVRVQDPVVSNGPIASQLDRTCASSELESGRVEPSNRGSVRVRQDSPCAAGPSALVAKGQVDSDPRRQALVPPGSGSRSPRPYVGSGPDPVDHLHRRVARRSRRLQPRRVPFASMPVTGGLRATRRQARLAMWVLNAI